MKKYSAICLLSLTMLLAGCGSSSVSAAASVSSSDSSSLESSSPSAFSSSSSSTEVSSSVPDVYYDVRFFDNDKTTLLYEGNVIKGGTAEFKGSQTPSKPDDESCSYKFSGWDKPLTDIEAATDFYPLFEVASHFAYKVTFQNDDGTVLSSEYFSVNSTPVWTKGTPSKDANESEYYTFTGWDKEPETVTDHDQVITAQYSSTAYSLTYAFNVDHFEVTGFSDSNATGLYIPDTHKDESGVSYPVTVLKTDCFKNLSKLFKIHLGKNITTFEDGAFFAVWFTAIEVEDGSPFNVSGDGHFLCQDKKLLAYGDRNVIGGLCSVPSGITEIGVKAINWVRYLTKIVLPDTVVNINKYGIFGTDVTSIVLSSALETIGEEAFMSDEDITELTFPKTLKSIGAGAFTGDKRLAKISYQGTKDDWAKVTLGNNWNEGTLVTAVTCTDGDVTL